MSNKDLTVYTAIFGDYDNLREPREADDIKFVCYTDNKYLKSERWEIRYEPENYAENPRWRARKCKLLSYKELDTDESIWVDARYEFVRLIRRPTYDNILLHTHIERHCAYDEADICLACNLGSNASIKRLVQSMKLAGFPSAYGLWWTATLWRKHTKATERLCDRWWSMMAEGCVRDQISLPFVLWMMHTNFTSHQLACDIEDFHSFVQLSGYPHLKNNPHENGNLMFK